MALGTTSRGLRPHNFNVPLMNIVARGDQPLGALIVTSTQSTTASNNFAANIQLTSTASSGGSLDAGLNVQLIVGPGWAKTGNAAGARFQGNWTNTGGTLSGANHLAGAIVINSITATGTISNVTGFMCGSSTNSGGATITNCQGVFISDQTIGTNNYGVNLNISAGTNKFNVYAVGTASNFFGGTVNITPASGVGLVVTGIAGSSPILINTVDASSAVSVFGPAATQVNALQITQGVQVAWIVYQPASSTDLRLYNGGDRLILTTSGLVKTQRFSANLGTVLVATDYAASAGWGTTPTKTAVSGTDTAATFTIVAKASVGANPTITLTFHDGTWTNPPVVVVSQFGLQTAAGAPSTTVSNDWMVTSVSATQVVFTYNGTPVANNTYGFSFVAIGT